MNIRGVRTPSLPVAFIIRSRYAPRTTGGVRVFYVLEFFVDDALGERLRLKTLGHEAPSERRAIEYAQAFLKNVTVEDKRPNLCLVKSVGGKFLNMVVAASVSATDPNRPSAIHTIQRE